MTPEDEPRTWIESEADRLLETLREQVADAKARMRDLKEGIVATGREPRAADSEGEAEA